MFADDPIDLIALALVILQLYWRWLSELPRRRAPVREVCAESRSNVGTHSHTRIGIQAAFVDQTQSAPSVPDNVADAAPVQPIVAVSSQDHT
jgi:hypothetical protein